MTDETNTQTTSSKAPSHIAYHVRKREGQKSIFTPIGAAWPHRDGNGFNIPIHLVPLDGLIVIRIPSKKPE